MNPKRRQRTKGRQYQDPLTIFTPLMMQLVNKKDRKERNYGTYRCVDRINRIFAGNRVYSSAYRNAQWI